MWDVRFHTDIMVGPKQIVPSANVEHGKHGWTVLDGMHPDGQRDQDNVWIGNPEYGWTRVHRSSVRYVRYRKAETKA